MLRLYTLHALLCIPQKITLKLLILFIVGEDIKLGALPWVLHKRYKREFKDGGTFTRQLGAWRNRQTSVSNTLDRAGDIKR